MSPVEIVSIEEGGEIFFERSDINLLLVHLKSEFNFLVLLDISVEDLLGKKSAEGRQKSRYEIVYHLLNLEEHFRLRIRVPVDGTSPIESIVFQFKCADWYEHEIWDMFGIQFKERVPQRLLNHQSFNGFPLRKDFVDEGNDNLQSPFDYFTEEESVKVIERDMSSIVNIGPVHPITRGAVRAIFELDGEKITRGKFEIGYFHRCLEKTFENNTWQVGLLVSEQLSEQSPFLSSFAYAHAVENLYNIEIPEKAKALRMIFSEFSRITDHLNCIGDLSLAVGNETAYFKCLDLKERVYELFEKFTGSRIKASVNLIGGISKEIPLGWISDCLTQVKYLKDNLLMLDKLLTQSSVFMARTNICKISAEMALEYGLTGPCLRAAGINYDLRKVNGYYFYNDVDFEVPLGINGLCYDRYLVRVEEVRQSLKIIVQILDNIPIGKVFIDHALTEIFQKNDQREFERNEKYLLNDPFPPVKRVYSSIESANGELGFYLISDGGARPWRVKVRAPSFSHLQALGTLTTGLVLDDALVAYSSFNITAGELDR